MAQRYFLTAESTYEDLRQTLNTQLAYPNALGKSVFQTALYAPRDGFRRVLLAVDTDLPNYAAIDAAISPLLASDAIEEIDEAGYLAAVASATAGASSWNDITGKPSEFPPAFHTHTVTDVTGAVATTDSRLTDARTPLAHVHSGADITTGTVAAARLGTHATTHNPGGSDPVTLVEVYEFTRTTKPAAATGSSGSYTFTIPAAAKAVEFFAVGAGGGGGSGRRGAAGSARFGGGGGGSGGVMLITRTVAELSSRTVSIFLGAGGTGGAAVTANDTNGNNGTFGSDTVLTISGTQLIASRGNGGSGGTNAAGAGGAGGNAQYVGNTGGASSATAVPSGPNSTSFTASGGAGGGGISTGDVSFSGAAARAHGWFVGGVNVNANGGTAPGGNGQNAADAYTTPFTAGVNGSGGGGAAGNASTAGGNGGNGANYGGAGGGGGASVNGFNSGAGGNGGDGFVRITVWY